MTRLELVAPEVRRISLPVPIRALRAVNVYLIDGANERTLVDTGMHTPEAEAALHAALDEAGLKVADIGRAFVTHLHPDHIGMAGLLERAGAELVMHRPEVDRARETWQDPTFANARATHEWFALHGMPQQVDDAMRDHWIATAALVDPFERVAVVDDGGTFDLGGRGARVVWTPGHTDFHAVLFDASTGTLFAGDHVLPRITPNISLHSYSRDDPLGDFLGALGRVRRLPVKRVLPAHGEPFDDLAGRVDELLVHHAVRLERVRELVTRERDAYTVATLLFPRLRSAHEERFALAETLAHLRHLERTGRAVPIEGRPMRWRSV